MCCQRDRDCGGMNCRGDRNCGGMCCQRDRDCGDMCCRRERDNDCPCMGEGRGSVRRSEEHEHHDHHDHDCKQGGPAAWNSFPSISSGDTCGCDAD